MSIPKPQSFTNKTLHSGLQIFPDQINTLRMYVQEITEKIPAKFVAVIGTSGDVILPFDENKRNEYTALGSLVAGDLAASAEIARLTGQYQETQLVIREGENGYLFLCEAGEKLILLAQVSNDVPMGWARLMIREYAEKISVVLEINHQPESDFDTFIDDSEIPDLFQDAFDSLFNGKINAN
jgi:predicted regulator of Ras-like GTPase activity (Roadblock/LC7/MglB family)